MGVRSAAAGWGLFVVLGVLPRVARADWPVARHDPQRTAFVPGTSHITNPGLAWRYYLGGALTGNQYWAGDVDGSGTTTVVYTAGGKVIAKRANDTVVWETPPFAINQIVDVWDVDGDGIPDVVAAGVPSVVDIFSGKDGSLEWSMPSTSGIGTLALVRTVDLDGDGKRDIYAASAGCATIADASAAAAYSFAGGFGAVAQLWTIPEGAAEGCNGGQDLIADVTGDGVPDIVRASGDSVMLVFNAKTGALESASDAGISVAAEGFFDTAPALDGGAAVVVFYESFYAVAQPNLGGRRVAGYRYDNGADGGLTLLWQYAAGTNPSSDNMVFDASSLGHFDSTGHWEVAFSLFDSSTNTWSLQVVDAASGSVVASLVGAAYTGAAVVDSSGIPAILANTTGGPQTVYKLSASVGAGGVVTGTLQSIGTPVGSRTTRLNRSLAAWKGLSRTVATTDIGGSPQLIMASSSGGQVTYDAVEAYTGGVGTVVASYLPPIGATLLGTEVFTDPTTGLPQPYLALSTGFLVVLNPITFAPVNVSTNPDFPLLGLRFGGYYSGPDDIGQTPVIGVLTDGGLPSVLARDSNGELVRLDPGAQASVIAPPTPIWSLNGLAFPALRDVTGDGFPEIFATASPNIYAYRADGTQLWRTDVTGDVVYDLPYGNATGDGGPDLFYETVVPGDVLKVGVLSGATGQPIWNPDAGISVIQWGVLPMAVGDMNGDGKADAVITVNDVTYYSGPTGAVLAANPTFTAYGEPLIANVFPGALPQVYEHGGYFPPRLDASDGGTLWMVDAGSTAEHWTYDYAAMTTCGDAGPIFVEGEYFSPLLHAYSARTGKELWRETLASGQAFASDSGVPAGTLAGFLGNVTIKQDLTGDGGMDALVGSTDGYLYAVQVCAGGTLAWTYDFGYPVGEPVLADSTGAGEDQILVEVADGYLYALNQQALSPPTYVAAVNPPFTGSWTTPVSVVYTTSTLYAEWPIVTGATSYQWAIFTSGGSIVGSQGFQTQAAPGMGATQVNLLTRNVPLVDGGTYQFVVRAVDGTGASSEAISNPVTVVMGGVIFEDGGVEDGGAADAGTVDAGAIDAGVSDAGEVDGGSADGGTAPSDGGSPMSDGGPGETLDGGVTAKPSACCGCTQGGGGGIEWGALLLLLVWSRRRARSSRLQLVGTRLGGS